MHTLLLRRGFAVITLTAMVAQADDCYISFDGPYLKSLPPQTSVQYTVGGSTTTGLALFMANWAAGKMGNSFVFSGTADSDNYVKVPQHATFNIGTDNFAISFWVKTRSQKTNNTVIDHRKDYVGYHVTIYNGRPLLQMTTASLGIGNYYPTTGPVINDGIWHKVDIYVTRDRTDGGKIYVDGGLILTFNPTKYQGTSLANTESLWIGRHLDWPYANFEGELDDMRIWKQ